MNYCHINTWTRPSRCYTAAGVLKTLSHATYTNTPIPADGDRLQMFFMARGNETFLSIGTNQSTQYGIWDLYINGVLDSAGYDDYAAVGGVIQRYIALTQPVRQGYNVFEMRVNGRNALATNWFIAIYGASIQ